MRGTLLAMFMLVFCLLLFVDASVDELIEVEKCDCDKLRRELDEANERVEERAIQCISKKVGIKR